MEKMNDKSKYSILINKKNAIPNEWIKMITLINIKDVDGVEIQVEKATYKNYERLKKHLLKKEKIKIGIDSAYRTREKQREIWEEHKENYGEEFANDFVAPVGHSEHETGLAIDLAIEIEGKWYPDFKDKKEGIETEFQKIYPYLSKFGFILRYPQGKDKITDYPYEYWHIRFVGKRLAKKIEKENWTLEEFYKI